ncbi:hypothetical protein BDZ97DRAFT_1906426 [Flammula alnicola]|nr:hypothetical protein BDZ97DRAFT_1906426 [Flammula alnicola]
MLVVDLLHEFELGVWKALFTHLIRLLYAAGRGSDHLVVELDRRYHQISTFGKGTIRTFTVNSSEMKKLAARDFEDLLQCAIPCFEGLLEDPHNRYSTLDLLEELTSEFGRLIRQFHDLTCSEFAKVKLPHETAARNRRQAQKQAASSASATNSQASTTASGPQPKTGRKEKVFNLFTVKLHFLGDYVRYIRLFGTTDSYSTQLVCYLHIFPQILIYKFN